MLVTIYSEYGHVMLSEVCRYLWYLWSRLGILGCLRLAVAYLFVVCQLVATFL